MFCLHKKWEMLDKPNSEEKSHCRCMKCGKTKFRKLPVHKNGRYNYLWCECGNNLDRESFYCEYMDDEDKLYKYVYKCDKCGLTSLWTFDIAPGATWLENVYPDNKRGKRILEHIKNIVEKKGE